MQLPAGVTAAFMIAASNVAFAQAADADRPEEIVVVGRVPGPPLWKVSNGEHAMWILPAIGMVPKDIEWETARVERLIAEAEELIAAPYGAYNVTVPTNPLSLARAYRMYRESTRLPDDQTLADVLPPPLYGRFSDLKAKYFPRDDGIEKLTPYYAAWELGNTILERENVAPFPRVMRDIDRFARRKDSLRRTDASYVARETVKPAEIHEMISAESTDFPLDAQLACLERRIAYFEHELPAIKRQANAWAQGRIDDLLASQVPRDVLDLCQHLPEAMRDEAADVAAVVRQNWLAAAEAALTSNVSTFAVLGLDDLIAPGGLLAALVAKNGYTVEISAARGAAEAEPVRQTTP